MCSLNKIKPSSYNIMGVLDKNKSLKKKYFTKQGTKHSKMNDPIKARAIVPSEFLLNVHVVLIFLD